MDRGREHHLQLPVEALQHLRRQLQPHHGRHRIGLQPEHRRHRLDAQADGHGGQRRRADNRYLGRYGGRRHTLRPDEHRGAELPLPGNRHLWPADHNPAGQLDWRPHSQRAMAALRPAGSGRRRTDLCEHHRCDRTDIYAAGCGCRLRSSRGGDRDQRSRQRDAVHDHNLHAGERGHLRLRRQLQRHTGERTDDHRREHRERQRRPDDRDQLQVPARQHRRSQHRTPRRQQPELHPDRHGRRARHQDRNARERSPCR